MYVAHFSTRLGNQEEYIHVHGHGHVCTSQTIERQWNFHAKWLINTGRTAQVLFSLIHAHVYGISLGEGGGGGELFPCTAYINGSVFCTFHTIMRIPE